MNKLLLLLTVVFVLWDFTGLNLNTHSGICAGSQYNEHAPIQMKYSTRINNNHLLVLY